MKLSASTTPQEKLPTRYARITFSPGKHTEVTTHTTPPTIRVGIGPFKDVTLRKLRTSVRMAVRAAQTHQQKHASLMVPLEKMSLFKDVERSMLYALIAENAVMGAYEFRRYKSKRVTGLLSLILPEVPKAYHSKVKEGTLLGHEVNRTRDLANTPGGDMTPQKLADEARRMLGGTRVRVRILKKRDIKRLKMGALLGVSKGSNEEPRFIILEYWGVGRPMNKKSQRKRAPLVFVGKGITFDSGGINLKPTDALLDMHLDMSGGAAVVGALSAIARLKIKCNVIGLIPAAENMVSGTSYRPGDVLTSMSGTTIDVLNTDAEGRLVLADALTYAQRYKPALVVDVATLTGAAAVALGQHATALMTRDEKLSKQCMELSEESGDYLWPLPLWDEYKQYTKGVFGDIANIATPNSRYGGAINGGMFLSHFTMAYPWVHLDIAPRMTAAQGDHLAKGATGEPVRLLVALARANV